MESCPVFARWRLSVEGEGVMTVRVRIDPNVRVRGNMTYADVDDDVFGGDARIGHEVEVFEEEAGIVGRGRICEIDRQTNLVYLWVNWASLKEVDS